MNEEDVYVRCVDDSGYAASLERGRYYLMTRPPYPNTGILAVVDESGEEYLFSVDRFDLEDTMNSPERRASG